MWTKRRGPCYIAWHRKLLSINPVNFCTTTFFVDRGHVNRLVIIQSLYVSSCISSTTVTGMLRYLPRTNAILLFKWCTNYRWYYCFVLSPLSSSHASSDWSNCKMIMWLVEAVQWVHNSSMNCFYRCWIFSFRALQSSGDRGNRIVTHFLISLAVDPLNVLTYRLQVHLEWRPVIQSVAVGLY